MTPTERAVEMKRRVALGKAKKAKKAKVKLAAVHTRKTVHTRKNSMPLQIGEELTMEGMAQALGFAHAHSFENWRGRHPDAPRGRQTVLNGRKSVVFSAADLEAVRQMRGEGKAAA
jgi:hypothetical protein